MALSYELISQFAKLTTSNKKTNVETTVYGTVTVDADGNKYVKLDGSDQLTPLSDENRPTVDSPLANANDGERVSVLIKNHTATVTGNISSPAARTGDVEKLEDDVTEIKEFDILIGERVQANEAYFKKLIGDEATIGKLDAAEISVTELLAKEADIDELISGKATITDLIAKKIDADIVEADYAKVADLDAVKQTVVDLQGEHGTFRDLTTEKLEAIDADIEDLQAKDAEIERLYAKIADVEDLYAKKAEIDNLKADVAEIDTLIFGSASGSTIQASFANAVIAQLGAAQIKSAMIESISADKIDAGVINTNLVNVKSEDGNLLISDETIQIKDGTRVRVQIGKDAEGDYAIYIWDAEGNLMFSEGGITDAAIKEAIIRDDMVASNANISASKLDISSLFSEINDSTETINSSKILIDADNQTLDVAFTKMSSDVNELSEDVSSQGTKISAIEGQISSKVWQQDINTAVEGVTDEVDTLQTQYSELNQTVDSISTTVASHTTAIAGKADSSTVTEITDRVTTVETDLDGFKTTVSETYVTQNEFDNLEIGGRNLVLNTSAEASFVNKVKTYNLSEYGVSNIKGRQVTMSFDAYSDEPGVGIDFYVRYLSNGSGIAIGNVKVNLTETYERYSATITVTEPDEDIEYFAIRTGQNSIASNKSNTATVYVKNVKVELGTKPTDWTAAPEDLDADISDIKSRISSAETSIEQNADAIKLAATKEEVTETLGGYCTKEETDAAIRIESDSITSSVSKTYATKEEAVIIPEIQGEVSNVVTVTDALTDSLSRVRVFGKTTQDGIPTPTAPVELVNVGAAGTLTVAVSGKNILDIQSAPMYHTNPFSPVTEISITETGVKATYLKDVSNSWQFVGFNIGKTEILRGKTITVSAKYNTSITGDKAIPVMYAHARELESGYVSSSSAKEAIKQSQLETLSFTVDDTLTLPYISVIFYYSYGGTHAIDDWTEWTNIQVEISDTSTEYEPYSGQTATFDTPDGLPGIPVSSEGTYIDTDGQSWICDEIDVTGNSYIQRIGRYTITGQEAWYYSNIQSGSSSGIYRYDLRLSDVPGASLYNTLSTHYAYGGSNAKGCWANNSGSVLELRIMGEYATLDDLTAFLTEQYEAGTPVTVYYVLTEPIETILETESTRLGNPAGDIVITSEGCLDIELADIASGKLVSEAAEDAKNAQVTADNALTSVASAETTIQQLADSIASLVQDGNGGSLIKQDAKGLYYFDISGLQNSISTTANDLDALSGVVLTANGEIDVLKSTAEALRERTEYVRSYTDENDQPCLELGEGDSVFKVRITNTEIQFAEGTSIPTRINRQMLIIEKAMVRNEMQFGDDTDESITGVWIWKRRSNGNLGLSWKVVSS